MIRRFACLAVFMAFVFCGSSFAEIPVAQPETVGLSSEKLALIVPAMQKFVDEGKVAGAITIVAKDGKIALFEAVGKQSIATSMPMKHDTIVRIYSMSKPITSVAVMMLADEGKLSLDDPVAKHLPEFLDVQVFVSAKDGEIQLEAAKRPFTIRDLLRHTSGLTYGLFGDTLIDQQYRQANVLAQTATLTDMMTKLGTLPLLYQPGTRFNYSVSTDVLGRVVEVVSGQRFDIFLRERIFVPLDMKDTGFFVPNEKQERFAATYLSTSDGSLRVVEDADKTLYRVEPRLFSGGGGLVSTAQDYIRFCQMLLNKGELEGQRILRRETVEAMTRNQLPDVAYPMTLSGQRDGVGFGLGFSVVREKTAYTALSHIGEYGWGGAASTHFWISPNDGLAVVVLSQLMPFSFQLENAIKPLVYDAIIDPQTSLNNKK